MDASTDLPLNDLGLGVQGPLFTYKISLADMTRSHQKVKNSIHPMLCFASIARDKEV